MSRRSCRRAPPSTGPASPPKRDRHPIPASRASNAAN
jgi:hypothetical protein